MSTRVILGVTLILGGSAVGIFAPRSAVGERTRTQAALIAAANRAAEARGVELGSAETKRAEAQAIAAAGIAPLRAGLRARVDGETLVDMFDNEDWWRPYRAAFPILRVVVSGRPLAAKGPDPGAAGDELVRRARATGAASAMMTIGGHTFVAAASRIPGVDDRDALLLFARPVACEPPPARLPAPTTAAATSARDKGIAWGVAGALGVTGLALVISARKGSGPGSVPQELAHEETVRLGTEAPARLGVTPGQPLSAGNLLPDGHALPTSPPGPPRPAPAASEARARVGVGASFGRYRLIDRLGAGGMSELFVAETTGVEGFTRNFVLKRLRRSLARKKEAVAQFIDEARMQASLVHSNIVPVFDFGVVDGEYFMTQEYIVGRDLGRLVHRHVERTGVGLPAPIAYYVAHETALALAYAHETLDENGEPLGIVHRDVSPGNVMVSLAGEVKLSDFGIVKSNRRRSQTRAGMVKGNASFMSPEQARGLAVDPRSDLFSLGHVLHHCLTGRLLYHGENDLDILHRAATGLTPADIAAIDGLPEPARGVLSRVLAFDPAERFQTASELADALAVHTGGGKAATARLMRELFTDEIQRQLASASASSVG
ncbi:MAG: Serine/threonine-protein kinase [Myxococcales bacterium]|nr:Serine/threonine-protein kinase [Myxococcales bacterium]